MLFATQHRISQMHRQLQKSYGKSAMAETKWSEDERAVSNW